MDYQKQSENFWRLQLMQRNAGNVVRSIFRERWFQKFKTHWQDTPQQIEQILKYRSIGDFCSSLRPEQREIFKDGDLEEWEIPLVVRTLVRLDLAIPSSSQFVQDQDKKLLKLVDIRNFLSHTAKNLVTDQEFQEYYPHIVDVLISAGVPKESIEKMIHAPLGELLSTVPESQDIRNKITKMKTEADAHFKDGNYQQAIQAYTAALQLSEVPETERAILYATRASCYLQLKTNEGYSKALQDSKKAIENWPGWATGHFRKGQALDRLGQFEKAVKALDRALNLDPSNEEILKLRSEVMDSFRQWQAQETFDEPASEDNLSANFMDAWGRPFTAGALKRKIKEYKKKDKPMHDFWVGVCFLHGIGRAQDDRRAMELFQSAAKGGVAIAMFYLGNMAKLGRGQSKDLTAAAAWWKKAVKAPPTRNGQPNSGIEYAENALGVAYSDGVGVKQDIVKACEYFTSAASRGYEPAMNNLGTLYQHGQGVYKDLKKAFEYYTAAAMKGSSLGMYNLAGLYQDPDFARPDYKKAKMWLKRAAEAGFQRAEIELSRLESALEDHPRLNNNNNPPKITFKSEADKKKFNNIIEATKNLKNSYSLVKVGPLELLDCLMEYQTKSLYANILIQAMDEMDAALSIMDKLSVTAQEEKQIITYFAQFFRHPNFNLVLFWDSKECKRVQAIAERLLSKNNEDEDAMVCYLQTKLQTSGDVNWANDFCTRLISVFPEKPLYYGWRGGFRMRLEQYKKAVDDFTTAIDMETDPSELAEFYLRRGMCKKMLLKSTEITEETYKAFQDFKAFLEHADAYHPQYPEAYFSIAWLLIPNAEEARFFYQKGLEAEKHMMPAFSAESGTKQLVRALLENTSDNPVVITADSNNNNAPTDVNPANSNAVSPMNSIKLELILAHRNALNTYYEQVVQPGPAKSAFQLASRKEQKMPKRVDLTALKSITIEELNLQKDKVYNGRILTGTLIECPFPGSGIHSIIQDDQGYCARISFNNLDDSFRQNSNAKLAVGRRISVVNPYVRIAADLKPAIKVDDPLTVIFLNEEDPHVCYCCLEEETEKAFLYCGRCGVARYCSKECQTVDWQQRKHKLVCSALAHYQQLVQHPSVFTGTLSAK